MDFGPAWDRHEAGFSLAELLVATTILLMRSPAWSPRPSSADDPRPSGRSGTAPRCTAACGARPSCCSRRSARLAASRCQSIAGAATERRYRGRRPQIGRRRSTSGMFVGEQLDVDAGADQETVHGDGATTRAAKRSTANSAFVYRVMRRGRCDSDCGLGRLPQRDSAADQIANGSTDNGVQAVRGYQRRRQHGLHRVHRVTP